MQKHTTLVEDNQCDRKGCSLLTPFARWMSALLQDLNFLLRRGLHSLGVMRMEVKVLDKEMHLYSPRTCDLDLFENPLSVFICSCSRLRVCKDAVKGGGGLG